MAIDLERTAAILSAEGGEYWREKARAAWLDVIAQLMNRNGVTLGCEDGREDDWAAVDAFLLNIRSELEHP